MAVLIAVSFWPPRAPRPESSLLPPPARTRKGCGPRRCPIIERRQARSKKIEPFARIQLKPSPFAAAQGGLSSRLCRSPISDALGAVCSHSLSLQSKRTVVFGMVQKPQIDRERGGIPVPLGERETAREVEEGKENRRIDDVTSFSASKNLKGREREREREREVIFPFRAAVSLNVSASPRGVTDIPSSSTSAKRSPVAGLPARERWEKGLVEGREERGCGEEKFRRSTSLL